MKVKTAHFGTVEVDEAAVITFPNGLIGLPKSTRFAILDGPEGTPFKWLQSTEEEWLALVMLDPLQLLPDYQVDIRPDDMTELKLADPAKAVVAVVCSIMGDARSMTINLVGPLVFNPEQRLAKQIIQGNSDYTTKHSVFPGQEAASSSSGTGGDASAGEEV